MSSPRTPLLAALTLLALPLIGCITDDPSGAAVLDDPSGRDPYRLLTGLPPDAGPAKVGLEGTASFGAPQAQFTQVPYIAEAYDRLGNYHVSTRSFTAPRDESYAVCASLAATSYAKDFELDLFVDGVRERAFAVARNGVANGCRTIALRTGNVLDVRVYQPFVGSLAFGGNASWDWMTIRSVTQYVAVNDLARFDAPSGQFSTIAYNTEASDPLNVFDPLMARLTLPAGDFQLCMSAASFVPEFEVDLFPHLQRSKAFAISSHGAATGCVPLSLTQDEYLDLRAYQGNGTPMVFSPNTLWNWLTLDRIHARRVSLNDIRAFTLPSDTQGVYTTVPFDGEAFDTQGEYDPTTGRFTAAEKGDYEFCASLTSFTGTFDVTLFVDGKKEKSFAMSKLGAAQGCRLVRLDPGHFVEVRAHQTTGAPIAFNPNALWNWMTVNRR